MTISTYLKKDIDSFLDEIQQQGVKQNKVREEEFSLFTLERDYAEETRNAFDNFDTNTIEKILKNLQSQVSNDLLEDDLREKISSVLEEVEEIVIKRINEVDSPSLAAQVQKIVAKRKKESATKQERDTMFKNSIIAINKFIAKKEMDQAKLAYQRLVKDFKTYSAGPESEVWREKIFSVYESIKNTDVRIAKEKIVQIDNHKEKIDTIKKKMSEVIQGLASIDPYILENKLVEIKQNIINAKISKEQGEAFIPILRTLVSKINFLKQTKEKEVLLEQKKLAQEAEEKKKQEAQKTIVNEEKEIQSSNEEKKPSIILSQKEIDLYDEANSLQNKGEFDQAKKIFEELLKKNPHNIRASIKLEEIRKKK